MAVRRRSRSEDREGALRSLLLGSSCLVTGVGAGFAGRGVVPVVCRQVVDARLGPELLHVPETGAIAEQRGESHRLTLPVRHRVLVLIAEPDRRHRALGGAMWKLALTRHVGAEVALLGRADAPRIPPFRRVTACH